MHFKMRKIKTSDPVEAEMKEQTVPPKSSGFLCIDFTEMGDKNPIP